MVCVVQLVEPQTVNLEDVGANPSAHPMAEWRNLANALVLETSSL